MSLERFIRRPVCTVSPETTLVEAARTMIEHSVGSLVLVDTSRHEPVGILTDRDIVVLIAEGKDPEQATVGGFSKGPLTCIPARSHLLEAADLMHKRGVRRLPIVDDDGKLVGIVSLDDLVLEFSRELHHVASTISEELSHERAITAPVSPVP